MVKGVNKLIVEVANPESELFERAIFFVKPEKKDTPPTELNKNADKMLAEFGKQRLKKNEKLTGALKIAGAAGLGAALTAILTKVLV